MITTTENVGLNDKLTSNDTISSQQTNSWSASTCSHNLMSQLCYNKCAGHVSLPQLLLMTH